MGFLVIGDSFWMTLKFDELPYCPARRGLHGKGRNYQFNIVGPAGICNQRVLSHTLLALSKHSSPRVDIKKHMLVVAAPALGLTVGMAWKALIEEGSHGTVQSSRH